jgi:hypothetical protein
MTRRNLVAVRAGDKSLHPHWLIGDGGRNWDLVVSYFGDDPGLYRGATRFGSMPRAQNGSVFMPFLSSILHW